MRTRCTVDGCSEVVNGHGYCGKHYKRWKKHGDPLGGDRNHAPAIERFWRRVEKTDCCWIWTGSKRRKYGKFQPGGKGSPYFLAHRYIFAIMCEPIPDGMIVMHSCDNPPCVNPAHLSLGTPKDNTRDMIAKRRKSLVSPKGSQNGKSVLTESKVKEIRLNPQDSHAALARRLGVSPNTVRGVRTGRTWSHLH